jgi:hypothetical protein
MWSVELIVCRMHAPSVRLMGQLKTLAARYPQSKFTAIVGDKCIPNYPDKMLPTLILYRGGAIKEQLVAWGVKTEGSLEGAFICFTNRAFIDIFRRAGGCLDSRRDY